MKASKWRRPLQEQRPFAMYPLLALCTILDIVAPFASAARGDWTAAVSTPILTAFVWIMWRSARAGVYVSDNGVRAIRLFSSSMVPWAELSGFEVRARELILCVLPADEVHTGMFRGSMPGHLTLWLRRKRFDELLDLLRRLHMDKGFPSDPHPTTPIEPVGPPPNQGG
jgi:hypothetical protein